MGRKSKAHEERRAEILDGAWALFTSRGYEGTTVAAIIDKLNISKGTFYHYFTSKEQVLDGITDRLAAEPLAELMPVVEDNTLAAGPKLNRFFEVSRRSRLRRIDAVIDVARVLYRQENLIVRQKIAERLVVLTLPALQSIIEQGIDEGCFAVTDAGEAALFLWHLSNTFADLQMRTLLGPGSIEQKTQEMVRRAKFALPALDRVLGAPEGTIDRPSTAQLKQFVRAVHPAQDPPDSTKRSSGPRRRRR